MLFLELANKIHSLTEQSEPTIAQDIVSLKEEYLLFVKEKALAEYYRTKLLLERYSSILSKEMPKDKSYIEAYLAGNDDDYLGLDNLTEIKDKRDHASRLDKIIQRLEAKRGSKIPQPKHQLQRSSTFRSMRSIHIVNESWQFIILKTITSVIEKDNSLFNKIFQKSEQATFHQLIDGILHKALSNSDENQSLVWLTEKIESAFSSPEIIVNPTDETLFVTAKLSRTVYYYRLLTCLHEYLNNNPTLFDFSTYKHAFDLGPAEQSLIKCLTNARDASANFEQLMTKFANDELLTDDFEALNSIADKIRANQDKFPNINLPAISIKYEVKSVKDGLCELLAKQDTNKLANLDETAIRNCLTNTQDATLSPQEQQFLQVTEIKFKSRLLDLVRAHSTHITSEERTSFFKDETQATSYNLIQQIKRLALGFRARLEGQGLDDGILESTIIQPVVLANANQRSAQQVFDMLFPKLYLHFEETLAETQRKLNKTLSRKIKQFFSSSEAAIKIEAIHNFLGQELDPVLAESCFTAFQCNMAIAVILNRLTHFNRAFHWVDYRQSQELKRKILATDFSECKNYYEIINKLHTLLTEFKNGHREQCNERFAIFKRNPLTFGSSRIQHLSTYLDISIKELEKAKEFYAPLNTLQTHSSDLQALKAQTAIREILNRINHFNRAYHWADYGEAQKLKRQIFNADYSECKNYYEVLDWLHTLLTEFRDEFKEQCENRIRIKNFNPLTFGISRIQHLSAHLDKSIKELEQVLESYAPTHTSTVDSVNLQLLLKEFNLTYQPAVNAAENENQALPAPLTTMPDLI